ncbi:cell adhesion molecule CEACAM6-like [Macrotis lagotis]|uniref:cell adhesion molecule CEACAM6-like n=1 Tax=Macrotis lagotis TaxID=92651 RepID=UPI003D683F94
MESPSEALHCGHSPWKRLLIIASILSCWIQSASAQGAPITIVPNPPFGTVGSDVILDIHGLSGPVFTYTWYRNSIEEKNKIAFYHVPSATQNPADIREKVFSNGSMLIPNLSLNDTKNYAVLIVDSITGESRQASGQLSVYEILSKPNITANRTNIIENDTVVLICDTQHDGMNISWVFKDKLLSLNERMSLSHHNQILTINTVKREDAGSYLCEIWNPISHNRSKPLILTVYYGPDNIRLSPNPGRGETEVIFKSKLNLVCHVESYPTAQYEWKVNGTNIPDFFSNTVIKNVSWEDSGKYTCLAKNDMTKLSVSKDITIKVVAKTSPSKASSLSREAITGIVIGVLVGVWGPYLFPVLQED